MLPTPAIMNRLATVIGWTVAGATAVGVAGWLLVRWLDRLGAETGRLSEAWDRDHRYREGQRGYHQ